MKQIIINLDFPEIQALEKAGEKDAIIKVVYSEMNLLTYSTWFYYNVAGC